MIRRHLRTSLLLSAVAAAVGFALTTLPATASAAECTVTCYKHPITGELICTPPCP